MTTPTHAPNRAQDVLHVFAGPTLSRDQILALAPHAHTHPPARHGDLLRLRARPGDTVLIIDGLWHQVPPVRHKEILELLARGVTVAGAASMGALRAAELHIFGMIGVGWVYQQYATGALDADDEVAVTQTPDGRPLSTALVCLRYALAAAAGTEVLTGDEAAMLLDHARRLPYHRRSWTALGHVAACAGLTDPYRRATAWLNAQPEQITNIKAADAQRALRLAAAGQLLTLTAATPPTTQPTGQPMAWADSAWRTSYLRQWVAAFQPAVAAGPLHLPWIAALHHAQLYDVGFSTRWRRRVLAWIAGQLPAAGSPGPSGDRAVEAAALAAAHQRGLTLDRLSPAQVEQWATPAEIVGLCRRDLLLALLVRSARLDPTARVWPEGPTDNHGLVDVAASAAAAARAWTTNQHLAATHPGHTPDRLDPDRISAHLADRWGCRPNDPAACTAAARDRGLLSFAQAVETARPFYLAARAEEPDEPGVEPGTAPEDAGTTSRSG